MHNLRNISRCPDVVLEVFEKVFHFPAQPCFGVVSTRQEEGVNCRMMRIYDINQNGELILLTHTHAQKWLEFAANPRISICFVSNDKLTQVILRGSVKLMTKNEAPDLAKVYWERIRPDVRALYHPDYAADRPYHKHSTLTAPSEVPETSGIVVVSADFWEILELVLPYTESRRRQFQYLPTGWTAQRMNLG